jgi:hypothetical protein
MDHNLVLTYLMSLKGLFEKQADDGHDILTPIPSELKQNFKQVSVQLL